MGLKFRCIRQSLVAGWVIVGLTAPLFQACSRAGTALLYEQRRERMVWQDIEGRGVRDPLVLQAMRQVAREEFVQEFHKDVAYADRPLPIGHGQTISQPYIVAYMSEMLCAGPDSVILEVGTGSGYQAAVLAEYVKHVYTIEIVDELATSAASLLERLGYTNVTVRAGDGYIGWEEHAPFDGIIVTAAPDHIPEPLVEQLKPGGRMIIPVGDIHVTQYLTLVEKAEDGTVREKEVLPVRFVPLTGDH